jgi:hypothetical protein
MFSPRLWVLASLALLTCFPPPGRPAAPPLRVDAGGHLLPAHARLRLGTIEWKFPGNIISMAFSPDGRLLVAAGLGGRVHVWDQVTGLRRFDRTVASSTHGIYWSVKTVLLSDGRGH